MTSVEGDRANWHLISNEMLRPEWVWAAPMFQSLQRAVSWDTLPLTSNQPWREQRALKPDLWLVELSRTASLCVCIRESLSFYTSLFVPFLPLSREANLLITGWEKVRDSKDQVTFSPHAQTADFIVSTRSTLPARLEYFWTIIFTDTCERALHVRRRALGLRVSCGRMMGLESRRWQITCNSDLLWWGLTLWRSMLWGNMTQRGETAARGEGS